MTVFLYCLQMLAWYAMALFGTGMTMVAWEEPCWTIDPSLNNWKGVVVQNCFMFIFTLASGWGFCAFVKTFIDLMVYLNAN